VINLGVKIYMMMMMMIDDDDDDDDVDSRMTVMMVASLLGTTLSQASLQCPACQALNNSNSSISSISEIRRPLCRTLDTSSCHRANSFHVE